MRHFRRAFLLSLYALFIVVFVQRAAVPVASTRDAIATRVSEHLFNYVAWEINALGVKAGQTLFGHHAFMDEATRVAYVRAYMADVVRAQQLEAAIQRAYIDPALADPASATAEQRAERDALRASLRERQTLAEAILEGQVAAVLVAEGFGTLGQLLPPISMRFTRVPNLLIVSPRDAIRFDIAFNLDPLPVDDKQAIEADIDARHDVASLIVPLGGIALYPAMVLETGSIPWAVETFAHEWLHHYLLAFPLGLQYFSGDGFAGETRIINETVADLFGKEIGRRVLARYYPDHLPPENPTHAPSPTPAPDAFDFASAMHATRVRVDALLAEGRVAQAEAYMEERRQLFVAQGYAIRKLNQAYFAFYGGYQAGGGAGAGGEDPIGPAVRALREASPTLHAFVVTLRDITTRDALLRVAPPTN